MNLDRTEIIIMNTKTENRKYYVVIFDKGQNNTTCLVTGKWGNGDIDFQRMHPVTIQQKNVCGYDGIAHLAAVTYEKMTNNQ